MAERNWTARPMKPEDFSSVRELYAAVRGNSRPEAYDRWRLLDNPVEFPPAMLAMDGERCVGLYLLWPTRLELGGQAVKGAQSVDTMTHPDYRNQGMFVALADSCFQLAAERGFTALYGFPNPHSFPGFVRRLNWDHTGDIGHWVRVIRPSGSGRLPGPVGIMADRLANLLPVGRRDGIEIKPGRPEMAELDRLLAAGREGGNRVARDTTWLDWRYHSDSQMTYEWLTALRDGRPVAAVAWGLRGAVWGSQADGRAKLVETLGDDHAALGAVIGAAIGRAAAAGAWMIETLTNLPAATRLLPRLAFFSHRKAPLIVRGLTSSTLGGNIHDHGAWRIVGGDVDTF